jgi:APA family basic amino acid/polyamine antiporter
MARDRVFLQSVAAIHPRYGTPARAIALQAVLASALVALGTFNQIVAYFIFVTVAFVGLTAAGVVVLRRRPGPDPGYLTPGYPATPAAFLVLTLVLLILLAGHDPLQAGLGVGVVALGWPVYYWLVRRRVAAAEENA